MPTNLSPMDEAKEVPRVEANDLDAIPLKGQKKQEDKKKSGAPWWSEEEIKKWKKRLKTSLSYMKSDDRWDNWGKFLNYLNCRWDDIHDDDGDHCNVNTLWSNLQSEIPGLYFQQPDVSVIAKKPTFNKTLPNGGKVKVDNLQAAKLLGKRMNQIIEDCNIEPTIERGIADAKAPYGHCWWKVGYGFTSEFDRDLKQEVTKATYWVQRVDPRTVLVDYMAPEMSKRRWTAHKLHREKPDLEENTAYITSRVKTMKTGIPEVLKERFDKLAAAAPDVKIVEFYELHDHVKKEIHWLAIDGTPQEIREPVKIKDWVEGSDFEYMDLNIPTDDSVYTLSDIEPVIDQAIARNKIRTSQVKHIENWGITIFTEASFWNDEVTEEEWRTVGNRVSMCKVADGALSQNKQLIVNPPAIPPDWYNMDGQLKLDNSETLALTAAQQGQTTGDTKAEVMTVNQASNVRTGRQRRKIKLAIINIVKKLAAKSRAHDDAEVLLDLTSYEEDRDFQAYLKEQFDHDGSTPHLEVNKEAWQGEYNFDFEIEEMLDRPKAVRVKQYIDTFAQLGQIPIFQAALTEEADAKYVLNEILELQGMRLDSLKKPTLSPELPPEFENQMADDGVEIPPPHKKDPDDLHIFKHLTFRQELQKAMPKLMKGMVKGDPEAMEAYEQVKLALRYIEEHTVLHNLQKRKKGMRLEVLNKANTAPGPYDQPQGRPVPTQEGIAQSAGAMPARGPTPQPGMMPPAPQPRGMNVQ